MLPKRWIDPTKYHRSQRVLLGKPVKLWDGYCPNFKDCWCRGLNWILLAVRCPPCSAFTRSHFCSACDRLVDWRWYPIFCFTCLILPYTFGLGGNPVVSQLFLPIIQIHLQAPVLHLVDIFQGFLVCFLGCLCGCLIAFSASMGRFRVCDSGSSVSFLSMIPICLLTLSLVFSSFALLWFFVLSILRCRIWSLREERNTLFKPYQNQYTHTLYNVATLTVIITITPSLSFVVWKNIGELTNAEQLGGERMRERATVYVQFERFPCKFHVR